jgi:predicted site-specific integrase-resolvase
MHTEVITQQEYVLPNEILDRFRISRRTLYSLVDNGRLHPVRLNDRVWRFLRTEVEALSDKLAWDDNA